MSARDAKQDQYSREAINPDLRDFLSFHFSSIEKEMEKLSTKQDKMESALFISNGKPSLVSRMTDNETKLLELQGKINEVVNAKETKKKEQYALWIAIVIVFLTAMAPKILLLIQKILSALV